jgi:hypothetical protein
MSAVLKHVRLPEWTRDAPLISIGDQSIPTRMDTIPAAAALFSCFQEALIEEDFPLADRCLAAIRLFPLAPEQLLALTRLYAAATGEDVPDGVTVYGGSSAFDTWFTTSASYSRGSRWYGLAEQNPAATSCNRRFLELVRSGRQCIAKDQDGKGTGQWFEHRAGRLVFA